MPQVVGDESRNEVVAVVVARVASQHQRTARLHSVFGARTGDDWAQASRHASLPVPQQGSVGLLLRRRQGCREGDPFS